MTIFPQIANLRPFSAAGQANASIGFDSGHWLLALAGPTFQSGSGMPLR